MPFGLKNAAQAFQRFMDEVCRGLEEFLFVYIDDILVASSNAKEHRRHLRLLFQRLAKYGLIVNVAKCVFGVDAIDFLGHRFTAQGIKPLPERVEAIHQFPRPQDAKSLGEFLGIVNFYHRFIQYLMQLHSWALYTACPMSRVRNFSGLTNSSQPLMRQNMLSPRQHSSTTPAPLLLLASSRAPHPPSPPCSATIATFPSSS